MQTAVTMRAVTGSMMNVVKGMDQAMKAMDLEKVRTLHFPACYVTLYFSAAAFQQNLKRNMSGTHSANLRYA